MLGNISLGLIRPNQWNPNKVDPLDQEKLEQSLKLHGQQIPIIVRQVDDLGMEIVDGEHRFHAATALGWESIQAINLGQCSEEEAKRKTIYANSRYGKDDNAKLFEILSSEGVFDTADQILATLPIDETELAGLFSKEDIDFDQLDALEEDLDEDGIDLGLDSGSAAQSHRILRFKVSNDDADRIEQQVLTAQSAQGYSGADALTNAGDALVYILQGLPHE